MVIIPDGIGPEEFGRIVNRLPRDGQEVQLINSGEIDKLLRKRVDEYYLRQPVTVEIEGV